MARLTQRQVDNLLAGPVDKRRKFYDKGTQGLYLFMRPEGDGRHAWIWERKGLHENLGDPRSLSLQDARDEAAMLNYRVNNKQIDPRLTARSRRASLGYILDRWLKAKGKTVKPSTLKGYKSYVNGLKAAWGDWLPKQLFPMDVEKLRWDYGDKPYQFNRMMAVLKIAWKWGQENAFIDSQQQCPTSSKDLYQERPRERFLTNKELSRLFQELFELENVDASNAIWLILMTGARRSEIEDLEWEWVDWENSIIRLPDSKTGHGRTLYLSFEVVDRLRQMRPSYAKGPVFPGLTTLDYWWRVLVGRAAIPDVRIHDLRHTFASMGLRSGVSLEEISKLLGHKDLRTTQRYAHLANDQMLGAADKIGRGLTE
jgi:integrase